ncbi:prosaposin [Scyliorhinus canicula]|uniref:prosaposin n=1 Tax=Scyliorhinus canicula TaxID=7830 RepID=UPI0018F32EB6|nr:prosaposin [Scyliorhinus canicula]
MSISIVKAEFAVDQVQKMGYELQNACFFSLLAVANPLLGKERCAEGPSFWCHDVKTASECGAVRHCQQTVWRQPTVKNGPCDLCKEVVTVMGNLLKDNATEGELRSYLEAACELLPSPTLTSECDELVDNYLPIILDILKGELENPEVVCSAMHLCQSLQENLAEKNILSNEIPDVGMSKLTPPFIANVPLLLYPQQLTKPKVNDDVCLDCSQFIAGIQTAAKDKASVFEELVAQLKQQCNLGAGLTQLVSWNHPSNEKVNLLWRLCCTFPHIHTDFSYLNQFLMLNLFCLQRSLGPVASSQGCVICEFAMRQIENLLQQNRTEEMIIHAVEKVCSLLPATVKSECRDFVEQYGQAVVELLAQELDPAFVCTAIGLCKQTDRVAVEKVKPKQLKAGPLCEVCQLMVEHLDKLIQKNSTEKQIEAALDKVCDLLPERMREECDQLVHQYEDALLQILLQTMDPNFVCSKLGLCLGAKPHLLGSDKCVWGPSYWCKNMDTASQCNAVEHCKRHIWN